METKPLPRIILNVIHLVQFGKTPFSTIFRPVEFHSNVGLFLCQGFFYRLRNRVLLNVRNHKVLRNFVN